MVDRVVRQLNGSSLGGEVVLRNIVIGDVRNAVFVGLNITFLCLAGTVLGILVCLRSIVSIGELDLVVTVVHDRSAENLIDSNLSGCNQSERIVILELLFTQELCQTIHRISRLKRTAIVCCVLVNRASLRYILDVLEVQAGVLLTAILQGCASGCSPVQGYHLDEGISCPLFRIDVNTDCASYVASCNIIARNFDSVGICCHILQHEVVACAAVCGLIRTNGSSCGQNACRQ